MSIWISAFSLAFAGELMVMAPGPVRVLVDGTAVDPVPGVPVVQVMGLVGIHKVEIAAKGGQTLQTMNVSVPQHGLATLVYDGNKLSLVPALPGSGGPPAAEGSRPDPKGSSGMPTVVVNPPPPRAMDEATFSQLVATMEASPFSSDKLDLVRTAATRSHFTIDQVGRLVDLLSFGSDQLELVEICQPKVVDPKNAFALASHFSFSSDREAALALFQ